MSTYRPPYSKLNLEADSLDHAATVLRAAAVDLPLRARNTDEAARRVHIHVASPTIRLMCPATAPAARKLADKCVRTAELARKNDRPAQGRTGATA